jgi:hypothetical protein
MMMRVPSYERNSDGRAVLGLGSIGRDDSAPDFGSCSSYRWQVDLSMHLGPGNRNAVQSESVAVRH